MRTGIYVGYVNAKHDSRPPTPRCCLALARGNKGFIRINKEACLNGMVAFADLGLTFYRAVITEHSQSITTLFVL